MTELEKSTLLSCPLFTGIAADDAAALLSCLRPREVRFARGESIWRQGDAVDSCAVVLSGAVRAEALRADGGRSVIAQHGTGALIGDVLMSTAAGRSPISLIMSADGELAFITFEKIMGGCQKCCPAHTKLRENLVNEIAAKYWSLRRKTQYLSTASLRQRIAMLLADRLRRETGGAFSLGFSREDMADYLAVNRSALSRELSRMRRDGLIEFERDRFRIIDAQALFAAADGE